jgi:hypothetical protein
MGINAGKELVGNEYTRMCINACEKKKKKKTRHRSWLLNFGPMKIKNVLFKPMIFKIKQN